MKTNTVIIFQQFADKDLVNRLSNLKQCPMTGQLYTKNQWQQEELSNQKDDNEEEEVDKEDQVLLFSFLIIRTCIFPKPYYKI